MDKEPAHRQEGSTNLLRDDAGSIFATKVRFGSAEEVDVMKVENGKVKGTGTPSEGDIHSHVVPDRYMNAQGRQTVRSDHLSGDRQLATKQGHTKYVVDLVKHVVWKISPGGASQKILTGSDYHAYMQRAWEHYFWHRN